MRRDSARTLTRQTAIASRHAPLVAHCHLGLGTLYGRIGKREQAHQHRMTAITMYHDMDMRFWLGKAEAEIGEPTEYMLYRAGKIGSLP